MTRELGSTRPYLLRAMHEWMTDNGQTPLVVVDATVPGVRVPQEHVKDDRIVLNIDWAATRNLQLENDAIAFDARFGGVPHAVSVPMEAVQGIYARESGQGMLFQNEPETMASAPEETPAEPALEEPAVEADGGDDDNDPPPKGPVLRLVK